MDGVGHLSFDRTTAGTNSTQPNPQQDPGHRSTDTPQKQNNQQGDSSPSKHPETPAQRKHHIMYKTMGATALKRLMTEYRELTLHAPEGITAGPITEENFFEWEALIEGPQDTPYEGGIFPATLTFPKDYPLSPPLMKFTCDMYHPNIYQDGTVCISILHAPGDDPNMYESSSERWSPVQSVEKILLSVLSMLAEPNDESGANIEACKVWRSDRKHFDNIVRSTVRKTLGL